MHSSGLIMVVCVVSRIKAFSILFLGPERYLQYEAAAATPSRPTYPLTNILYALPFRSTENCVEQKTPSLIHLRKA